MASDADLKNFYRIQQSAGSDTTDKIVQQMPPIPEDVKKRFPAMAAYEEKQREWVKQLIIALRGGQGV